MTLAVTDEGGNADEVGGEVVVRGADEEATGDRVPGLGVASGLAGVAGAGYLLSDRIDGESTDC